MAFLFISAKSSVSAETTSGLLVLGATLLDVPGTGEALRVSSCDTGAAAGVSDTCRSVGEFSIIIFITRLGENTSSGIIEGLKGEMPVVRNPALILAGVAVLSHATVKMLPNLRLVRVRSVLWL